MRIFVFVPKLLITLRLEPDLAAWASSYAGEGRRTALIEELLAAVRERRLLITSTPAPHDPETGADPARPVLVSLNPK
jgi:hypothetical protein